MANKDFYTVFIQENQGCWARTGQNWTGIHLGSPEPEQYLEYCSSSTSGYKKMKQTQKKSN
jgi:hypothetical protein